MKTNKKALTTSAIVFLILAIFTLIILLNQITTKYNSSNYFSSIYECSYFSSQIKSTSAFFNKNPVNPNLNLINSIAITCPSKTININKKEIEKASKLVLDCWDKSNKGENIFPDLAKNTGICLYCGRIKFKEKISNFDEKILNDLKKNKNKYIFNKTQDSVNLNNIYLSKNGFIPKNPTTDKSISIFYYSFKPQFAPTNEISVNTYLKDEVLNNALTQFGRINAVTYKIANKLTPNTIQTYSGVVLTNQKEYQENQILNIDRNNIAKKKCTIIIPKKNYE